MAPQKHRDDQLFVAPVTFNDDVTFNQMPTFTGGLVANSLLALDPAGPAILEEAASAINPTIIPNQGDLTSGVGSPGDRAVNLIAGDIDAMRFTELNGSVLTAPEANVGLTADVGSSQGDGVITSSYNVYSTVATAGDAATLPAVFAINSLIYIKNDGAQSMDVFPALGDNAGAGVNTAVAIPSGQSKTFIGTVADATWTELLVSGGGVPDPLLLGDGTAAAPTYSFAGDPDTGTFLLGPNQLAFAVNGIGQWVINPTELSAFVAGGPLLRNFDSTGTIPNIISDSGDVDTGIGNAAPDQLSFIAGGVEGLRVSEVGGLITIPTFGPILMPLGTAADPSLSYAGDPDTGFFNGFANTISATLNGARSWTFQEFQFATNVADGPSMMGEASTITNPTLIPHVGDVGSGVGGIVGQPALIANGLTCLSVRNTAGARQIGFYEGSPISLQTGVAVTTAAIHAALVNLRLFTA